MLSMIFLNKVLQNTTKSGHIIYDGFCIQEGNYRYRIIKVTDTFVDYEYYHKEWRESIYTNQTSILAFKRLFDTVQITEAEFYSRSN